MFTTIKFNGDCHEWLPIQDVQPSEENSELYGNIKLDRTYIEVLKSEFSENGLNKPIEVWDGGKKKKTRGGHHRLESLKELGEQFVPVIYIGKKPKSKIQVMEQMVDDNMRKPQTTVQKYNQVKTLRNQRIKDVGHCNDTYIKRYCTKVQTTFDTYQKLVELDEQRPDLFDRVASDEDGLSVSRAYKMLKEDKQQRSKQLAAAPALDNLIKEEHIKKAILSLQDFMHRFYNLEVSVNQNRYKFVPQYQENILSGIAHETFSHTIARILTEDKNIQVDAPKNQRAYDLVIPGYCWEPEVKFAKWNGKNASNIHWQGRFPKSGYYFLIAVDQTFHRFYLSYGFIEEKMWERDGQLVKLTLENAYKSGLKTFLGEIKEVNNEYQIHLDKPSI